MLPSPLQHQLSTSSAASSSSLANSWSSQGHGAVRQQQLPQQQANNYTPYNRHSMISSSHQPFIQQQHQQRPSDDPDVFLAHYANAYSVSDLKTYHCDRVRKMPLSGLDPSMLVGFLCRDEQDWVDFRARVNHVSRRRHFPPCVIR
jgi:cysteine protease ATG4